MVVLAILLLAAVSARAASQPTIIVLPFDAPDFPAPLRDDLREWYRDAITRRTRLRAVAVYSAAVPECPEGRDARIPCLADIGRRLGVGYVADGKLAKVDGGITARVIVVESASGAAVSILYSRCAERDGEDVFACLTRMARTFAREYGDVPRIAPPLDRSLVAVEFVAGGLFATLGAVGGAAIGGSFGENNRSEEHWRTEADGNALLGLVIGLYVGAPIGIWAFGSSRDQTGSLAATTLGTFLGSIVGLGMGFAAAGGGAPLPVTFLLPIAGASAGGTLAFNMTRRYKDSAPPSSALLDVSGDHVEFGVPAPSFRMNPIDGAARRAVSVVRVRF